MYSSHLINRKFNHPVFPFLCETFLHDAPDRKSFCDDVMIVAVRSEVYHVFLLQMHEINLHLAAEPDAWMAWHVESYNLAGN